MPPRVSWRNLLPGLIAFAVIVLIAVGVLVFAGVGSVRGEKIRLYVLTDQARGVMRGSDVWLAGQKIGTVSKIVFRPPSANTSVRVVIAVDVRAKDAEQIRHDSRAQVRAGANIIGPIVVYLEAGTPSSPGVRDGDTLRARPQPDIEVATAKLNAATQHLGPLMADARKVVALVRDPNGTVGAALNGEGGGRGSFARLRATVARVRNRKSNGNGAEPSAPTVMALARGALARADSIRALLSSNNSALGRFRRDASLQATVADIRDELTILRTKLAKADGTMGRFKSDSAITRSVADAQREMARLSEDIRKRPLRYVHF
jgi:phospholipid/cholesterol/gamma-HCH transport system substrate-binding protein